MTPFSNGRVPPNLTKALREAKSFAIVGHVKPDADTLGSSLALSGLLRRVKSGRRIVLANASPIPAQLQFLPRWDTVVAPAQKSDLKDLDCAIYLECANPERAGGIAAFEEFRLTLNIDHHITGKGFAHVNWINPHASSNAEQVYMLYKEFGFVPTKEEATWLYAGIVSDTGRFQYSLTSPATHRVAAELLETGIPHTRIMEHLFTIKTVAHLRLLATALSSMRFHLGGRVTALSLSRGDFAKYDFHATQTEDIVNYGLAPKEVEAAFFMKEEPFRGKNVVSVSLRSRGRVDVSVLAQSFGGGGHKNAAGCEIADMTMDKIEKTLVERMGNLLKKRK
ncbi:MAG: bifunctional oligoribonuclease/PAP phosphatase NrnA [Elusimicrobia bacterium]|nr:bifunctional oligoribonuclease/PAP phosphatase NrnA [Elusimicrobiota bacterium]